MAKYGPADSFNYKHNYRAFRTEVLQAAFMENDMVDRATRAQAVAQEDSPRLTGRFAESWVVESGRAGGLKHDRAFAELVNTDPHAADIEFGHDIPVNGEGITYTASGRKRKRKISGPRQHVDGAHVLGKATTAMGD